MKFDFLTGMYPKFSFGHHSRTHMDCAGLLMYHLQEIKGEDISKIITAGFPREYTSLPVMNELMVNMGFELVDRAKADYVSWEATPGVAHLGLYDAQTRVIVSQTCWGIRHESDSFKELFCWSYVGSEI
jgi:hypothetical protein